MNVVEYLCSLGFDASFGDTDVVVVHIDDSMVLTIVLNTGDGNVSIDAFYADETTGELTECETLTDYVPAFKADEYVKIANVVRAAASL